MANNPTRELISKLDRLLNAEHEYLLQGKLDEIGRLTSEKETIVEELNLKARNKDAGLKSLHGKIVRNQRLLTSASQGIRAVSNRMANLRRVRSGLETYDRSGNRKTFGNQATQTLEKRA